MYSTFVSIFFAFALGFLLIPIESIYPVQILGADSVTMLASCRFALMLFVILSLWWWYAIFLARVNPSERVGYFIIDFLVMTSTALAAKLWPSSASWLVASVLSIAVLNCRFGLAAWENRLRSLRLFNHFFSRHVQPLADDQIYHDCMYFTSDKRILRIAFFLLLTSLLFGVFGSAFMWTQSGDLRRINSHVMYPLFACTVVLGIIYTILVAAVITNRERTAAKAITPASDQARGIRDDRFLPIYSAFLDTDEQFILAKDRLGGLIGGMQEFDRDLKSSLPSHMSQSKVHSSTDEMVQAFAMSLQFDDAQTDPIRTSGYITAFLHWFDDCIDGGYYMECARTWLDERRRAETSTSELVNAAWADIYVKKADQEFIEFVKRVEDRIPDAARIQFNRGLRRLVTGAVLLTLDPLSRGKLGSWLLKTHLEMWRESFREALRIPELSSLNDLDPRFIALTSKPIQECWDAVCVDSLQATLLFNLLLVGPVLLHNSQAEEVAGELNVSWTKYYQSSDGKAAIELVRAVACKPEVTRIVMKRGRRKQLQYIRKITNYLDTTSEACIDAVLKVSHRKP